jgi:PIN domain nuclease of toxin-antitoxin system
MYGRSVVDASVVLAWLQDEPGAGAAEPMLMEGVIGAANWSEVLQKSKQANADPEQVARLLTSFGLEVADVTERDGARAAGLWRRGSSLSLADRLYLALAERLELPVATIDAAWQTSGATAAITLIR